MKQRLDQFVLDIEFLLISVIQGVALSALASASIGPLVELNIEVLPFILSGFLIILTFWSGAIIHALSFIDWPMNMWHSFLYFLASFFQVIAFSQISTPFNWFLFMALFFLVIWILYILDLKIIIQHKNEFEDNPERKKLFSHIKKQQIMELSTLVPLGLFYNLGAIYLLQQGFNVLILGALQTVFLLIFLLDSMNSFKKRTGLITKTF